MKDQLIKDLQDSEIQLGDVLLVHSSLSKIGYVEGGAQSVVEALLETVGSKGHLLMPTSPNPMLQLDFIRKLEFLM